MLLRSGEEIHREAEAELLGACLVAAVDHGPLAPSALVARTIASTRATPMSALAGGILAFGEIHGAVVTRAMLILRTVPADGDIDAWADATFLAEREAARRLPGIGHRWHSTDLRAERLLQVAGSFSDGRPAQAVRASRRRRSPRGRPVASTSTGARGRPERLSLDPIRRLPLPSPEARAGSPHRRRWQRERLMGHRPHGGLL
jgi:citrate synthase